MPALGEVIDRASELVRGEGLRFVESASPQIVWVALHQFVPLRLRRSVERGKEAGFVEDRADIAPPLAAAAQLPPTHARLPALLIQGDAFRVARFGKDAHAEPSDASLPFVIVFDDGKPDGGRSDVESENLLHAKNPLLPSRLEISNRANIANREVAGFRKQIDPSRGLGVPRSSTGKKPLSHDRGFFADSAEAVAPAEGVGGLDDGGGSK